MHEKEIYIFSGFSEPVDEQYPGAFTADKIKSANLIDCKGAGIVIQYATCIASTSIIENSFAIRSQLPAMRRQN